MLKIDLYGDINIKFNDCDITQQLSKKSIGIIAYLLCAPAQQASKESLKDLFWIDAGEKAAYNLRFNLWNIKKCIPEVDGESFILSSAGGCRINPNYPYNVSDIDKIIDSDEEDYLELLENISNTSSGLIFLEHFYLKDCDNFNDWVVLERNNKERQLLTGLSRAEEYFEENESYKMASNILEIIIALSPFEDEYRIRMMKLYAKQGKYVELVKEYKSYNKWLKKEMGIGPSRKLRETYLKLIRENDLENSKILIEDKIYKSDYSAVIEMIRKNIETFGGGFSVQIDNWDSLDQKSKEFFEALIKEKIIILGGK